MGRSAQQVERALRRRVPGARLSRGDLWPFAALIDLPDRRVRVDIFQHGLVPALVHELLHDELAASMEQFDDDLEEVQILALERRIMDHINLRKARWYWWRNAVKRKLA